MLNVMDNSFDVHMPHTCFYLQTFPHDIEPLKKKADNFVWSLDQLNLILQHIDVVKEVSRRNLILDIVEAFESKVLTRKSEFRKGKRLEFRCG